MSIRWWPCCCVVVSKWKGRRLLFCLTLQGSSCRSNLRRMGCTWRHQNVLWQLPSNVRGRIKYEPDFSIRTFIETANKILDTPHFWIQSPLSFTHFSHCIRSFLIPPSKNESGRVRNQLRTNVFTSPSSSQWWPLGSSLSGPKCGNRTTTDQDCRADVPMFSNEFSRIFLGLMQLCVAEHWRGAESYFE